MKETIIKQFENSKNIINEKNLENNNQQEDILN